MTDPVALGRSDEGSRWIGIRRHQAVAFVSGLLLVGDSLVRANSKPVEGAIGLLVAAGALPAIEGLTLFELVFVGFKFVSRSRWTMTQAVRSADGTEVSARGRSAARGFELIHRGRLDLSGRDVSINEALVAFADGLASSPDGRHFSIHVLNDESATRTVLILSPGLVAPEGWRPSEEAVGRIVCGSSHTQMLLLERWRHLRGKNGVLRILRVHDFSSVPVGRHLLDRLQVSPAWADLSLHVQVVDGRRASGIAARAVHRSGSDSAASTSVGFRRTARTARSLARMRESEMLVASGRSLLQIGVFIVVRAQDLRELSEHVDAVRQSVLVSGLRCQLGVGRQSTWYCQQLPGAPGW